MGKSVTMSKLSNIDNHCKKDKHLAQIRRTFGQHLILHTVVNFDQSFVVKSFDAAADASRYYTSSTKAPDTETVEHRKTFRLQRSKLNICIFSYQLVQFW